MSNIENLLNKLNTKTKKIIFILKFVGIIFISILLLPFAISFWIGYYIAKRKTENRYEIVKIPKIKRFKMNLDSNKKSEKDSIYHEVNI